ncbi:MAG TPA: hypothetical protein VLW85_20060 [Myxococcales bacterium]|nr:hypothetical protein [Myxococcales bacterium]
MLFAASLLLLAAARADAAWWQRHVVVPACYLPPAPWLLPAFRIGMTAVAGALLGLAFALRPTWSGAARTGVALLAALAAVELTLRVLERPERSARHPRLEWLLGVADPRSGWSFVPRTHVRFGAPGGGPVIDYSVDRHGDRAPSVDFVEDLRAPTLIVTGESIAVGHGLPWSETFAAQAGARLGLQVVNVAEGGYGSDQALLRARDALQRLQRPALLVSTVLPVQLHRNLDDSRPHMELRDGQLQLDGPFAPRLLLRELIADRVQVLPEWRLQKSLRLTRAILEATAQVAREHGAHPLFLAPVYGPPPALLRELLQGLPATIVQLEPARIMPWDGHPDAEGARSMADAVVQYFSSP